ncbi:hypothetical protein RHSIM_Rhsim03G0252800 [Rhododendron simsii]|uniref:Prolamin-like domain-containing protein n=1 Tax=Rhododendron simsii TaxID=118357 RepID=A0A834LUR3_RHOSS|nr:hypothetical protein RHSIM_Rhsim03G0252800 [Rhododendron simsii]
MSRFTAAYSFAVIASCLSMLVAATLAQTWGGIGTPGIPGIPGISAPGIPGIPGISAPRIPGIGVPGIPGVGGPGAPGMACWDSLRGIRGCAEAVVASARSGRIQISPECCQAIMAVADTCWPKMFPFNPLFPPMLKNRCMGQDQSSPLLPPPPTY